MSKQVTVVTNGTYTFEETEVENQFHFFRNDHGVLENVGTLPIEMFSRYLIHKVREREINEEYEGELCFELSADGKVLRVTASEQTKPNLHIVEVEECEAPEVTEPNFFKRIFAKWFDK